MRLKITESKMPNLFMLFVLLMKTESILPKSSKLGTYAELFEKIDGIDPIAWAKAYIKELNEKEKAGKHDVSITFSPTKPMEKKQAGSFQWRIPFPTSYLLHLRFRFYF